MAAMAELPEKKAAPGTVELDQVQQDLLLMLKQTEAHLSGRRTGQSPGVEPDGDLEAD